MDAAMARIRIVKALSKWVPIEPDSTRCVDDRRVDYAPGRVRVPEESLFPMTDDGSWAPFLDGGSPWLHANLVMTVDGRPIVTLATRSLENGRKPSGTHTDIAINVSFQDKSVAEVVRRV